MDEDQEDSFRDRQENEKAALQAIYGDQLTDVSGSEDSWRPLECILTLWPRQSLPGDGVIVPSVDLHVICPENYPQEVPEIKLEKWKKVPNQQINILHDELFDLANQQKGEVMIFELAQHVESFLHQFIKPEIKSFYEEMMIRNKKLEEVQLKEKKALEEKMREETLRKIQTQQQAVRKALRRKSVGHRFSECDERAQTKECEASTAVIERRDSKERINDSEDYSPWSICGKGNSRFENEFEHIKWLGKGAFGEVLKVKNKLDDGYYAIKKIELNASNKQLNKKITREVKLLSRLNHENVVRYYNSWVEIAPEQQTMTDKTASSGKEKHLMGLELHSMREKSEWTLKDVSNDSDSSSDWIAFESNAKSESSESETENRDSSKSIISSELPIYKPLLYLYIQMELCEKSTLRITIDDGLYMDCKRVWRLFREIVEGLCHIHQQGIIHRDLKPVNIFIGNDDHVKIGDFGLATTNILPKLRETTDQIDSMGVTPYSKDLSQTGQVGTTLYVAPELNNCPARSSYNQKVDVYSLGVIFFEMCHPPFCTRMERFKVLMDLRKPEIQFPSDSPVQLNSPEYCIIRSMLNPGIKERPSSKDILSSKYLPPPELEEAKVKEMVRRTLSNPQSKDYKYLVASCFDQAVEPTFDATYNIYSWRSASFMFTMDLVTEKLTNIFHRHGAASYLPPLLTPARQIQDNTVCLMTKVGGIVHVPLDLKVPFARYLIHHPSISHMKRYAIDKVYREMLVGVHPREANECAFDIVTPSSGDFMPEFEVLSVIWEILNEFPPLLRKNCFIYLNHSSLVACILKHCGLEGNSKKKLCCDIFNAKSMCISKQSMGSYLRSLPLTDHAVNALLTLLYSKGPLNKVTSLVNQTLQMDQRVTDSLRELETIVNGCDVLGITCPVLINLGISHNVFDYSGIIFQVECDSNRKRYPDNRVLWGGRYDKLLEEMRATSPPIWPPSPSGNIKPNQCVVGFSLSVDIIISCLNDTERPPVIDVLVSSMGSKNLTADRLSLLKDLWRSGIKTIFLNMQSLEDLQTYCLEMNIPLIVILKENDPGFARVRAATKESKFSEKKVPFSELMEYLLKNSKLQESNASLKQDCMKSLTEGSEGGIGRVISFVTMEKLNPGVKRRYESQILNSLSAVLQRFSTKVRVEVLALTLETEPLKNIDYSLDISGKDLDMISFAKKFPRHKKYVQKIFDHIDESRRALNTQVIILYSLCDNTYKVIV